MRAELAERQEQRFRLRATFTRFGQKRGWKSQTVSTVLLSDVMEAASGKMLTDHLWMTAGAWSEWLEIGDVIEFDGRVTSYVKGYFGHRQDVFVPASTDWKVGRPTKVEVVSKLGGDKRVGETVAKSEAL